MDFDPFIGENDDKRAGHSFNLRRCPIQIRIDGPNDSEINVLQTESYEESENNRHSHVNNQQKSSFDEIYLFLFSMNHLVLDHLQNR